jgi:hypothetical protein
MTGYLIFAGVLAALSAPFAAAARLSSLARRQEREDVQARPVLLYSPLPLAADTPVAAELRRQVALRMTGRQS